MGLCGSRVVPAQDAQDLRSNRGSFATNGSNSIFDLSTVVSAEEGPVDAAERLGWVIAALAGMNEKKRSQQSLKQALASRAKSEATESNSVKSSHHSAGSDDKLSAKQAMLLEKQKSTTDPEAEDEDAPPLATVRVRDLVRVLRQVQRMLRGRRGHTLQLNEDGTIAAPTARTHEQAVRALSAAILRVGYDAAADEGAATGSYLNQTIPQVLLQSDRSKPGAADGSTGASPEGPLPVGAIGHSKTGRPSESVTSESVARDAAQTTNNAGTGTGTGIDMPVVAPAAGAMAMARARARRTGPLPRQLSAKWASQVAERVVRLHGEETGGGAGDGAVGGHSGEREREREREREMGGKASRGQGHGRARGRGGRASSFRKGRHDEDRDHYREEDEGAGPNGSGLAGSQATAGLNSSRERFRSGPRGAAGTRLGNETEEDGVRSLGMPVGPGAASGDEMGGLGSLGSPGALHSHKVAIVPAEDGQQGAREDEYEEDGQYMSAMPLAGVDGVTGAQQALAQPQPPCSDGDKPTLTAGSLGDASDTAIPSDTKEHLAAVAHTESDTAGTAMRGSLLQRHQLHSASFTVGRMGARLQAGILRHASMGQIVGKRGDVGGGLGRIQHPYSPLVSDGSEDASSVVPLSPFLKKGRSELAGRKEGSVPNVF